MATTTEYGHANNVANFRLLIEHCTALGTHYNPSNPLIKLPALQAKYTEAETIMQSHRAKRVAYDNAINAREIAFQDLKTFSTRVVAILTASGATEQTMKDAKTVLRKIRGKRAVTKQKNEPNESLEQPIAPDAANVTSSEAVTSSGAERSVSQLSYDLLYTHFADLVAIVSMEPKYNPNETEFKTTGLNDKLTVLENAIHEYMTHQANHDSSIIQRNNTLYATITGLTEVARATKSYIKALYGFSSPQYKTIVNIYFKKR